MTDREQFCTVVSNGPLLRSDVVVVLAGEDGEPRTAIAAELMRQGGARFVVISGGVENPPKQLGANTLHGKLTDFGLSPERIILELESQNTREQAINVSDILVGNKWQRALLVASPYHQFRAFLTFVHELRARGMDEAIQIVNVPAAQLPWFRSPPGIDRPRLDLLTAELVKIDIYREKGDCATYAQGLDYLRYWEGR